MKIEYEIKNVKVVRHHTIAEALTMGLGNRLTDNLFRFVRDLLRQSRSLDEKEELIEVLGEPLLKEYEGKKTYERTIALVSLDKEIGIREFYQELAKGEYYPASVSEGMSYLPILASDGVRIDAVLHLGTFLRNEEYIEQRLLTRKNGSAALVAFHPTMKLKPYYRIIVVKAEKKQSLLQ